MAVIAVDVDGVLADFCGGFADYVSRRTGKSRSTLPNPTSWNFWGEWGLTAEQFYELFGFFGEAGAFGQCPIYPEAREGLYALREAGHRILIATARGAERLSSPQFKRKVQEDTIEWLSKHNLPFDDLCFVHDKGLLRASVLLDDATHNLTRASEVGIKAVCFDQPYNQDWKGDRVRNWAACLQDMEVFNV